MTSADPSLERFGALLRHLKSTYGWPSIRTMATEDLMVLLKRSVRSQEDRVFLEALHPEVLRRLIDLLSTPPHQREQQIIVLASALSISPEVVAATLKRLDRTMSLSRADRRSRPHVTGAGDESPSKGRPPWFTPLVAGGVAIGLAGAVAITIQIDRYRQEVLRQQLVTREQKAELDRVKQQLEESQQAITKNPSAGSLSSSPPGALSRPSLPTAREGPPRSMTEQAPPPQVTQPSSSADLRWRGCEDAGRSSTPPQSGDTWWPVVGPAASLQAVQQHCRADAFRNRDGNVQVASFPSRIAAAVFADAVTSDPGHPYTFYVGEPTTYD